MFILDAKGAGKYVPLIAGQPGKFVPIKRKPLFIYRCSFENLIYR